MTRFLLVAILGLGLAGCSSGSLSRFQSNLNNVTTGVASVNDAIAKSSRSLAQNCTTLRGWAGSLASLTAKSRSAGPAFAAANASVVAYCQELPSDIPTAIQATGDAARAARSAYAASKAGN